jgi:hypothetical protein
MRIMSLGAGAVGDYFGGSLFAHSVATSAPGSLRLGETIHKITAKPLPTP